MWSYFLFNLKKKEKNLKKGFGEIGKSICREFIKKGAIITGILHKNHSIYDSKGLNVENILKFSETQQNLKDFPQGEFQQNDSVMFKECDILVLGGLDNVINSGNADKVQAKIILEASNSPISLEGDEILTNKNIVILPDVLMGGGGIIVSYLEFLKNLEHVRPGRMTKKVKLFIDNFKF